MVISNEPGYYEDGKYGIRIENSGGPVRESRQMLKPEDDDAPKSTEKKFLKFKITMIPMQKKIWWTWIC
jgi:hypothetical protein